ncbi:uncharacterized protein METZ01_LOCUS488052, partial [marine metagenome]
MNSKQLDLHIKMSPVYKEKEMQLREIIANALKRGKIELAIWSELVNRESKYYINTELVKNYYNQIKELQKEIGNEEEILQTLFRMPEIIQKERNLIDKNECEQIKKGIDKAIKNLLLFRKDEGIKLSNDITARVKKIKELLKVINPLAKQRIEKVKKSLQLKLNEIDSSKIDEDRFEQELLYYLEKQSISEEQIRLKIHLDYFLESMEKKSPNGKKLSFITQEMGREINTIGSKSSNAD